MHAVKAPDFLPFPEPRRHDDMTTAESVQGYGIFCGRDGVHDLWRFERSAGHGLPLGGDFNTNNMCNDILGPGPGNETADATPPDQGSVSSPFFALQGCKVQKKSN